MDISTDDEPISPKPLGWIPSIPELAIGLIISVFLGCVVLGFYLFSDTRLRLSVNENRYLSEQINKEFGPALAAADIKVLDFPHDQSREFSYAKARTGSKEYSIVTTSIGYLPASGLHSFPYSIKRVGDSYTVSVKLDTSEITSDAALQLLSRDIRAVLDKFRTANAVSDSWNK